MVHPMIIMNEIEFVSKNYSNRKKGLDIVFCDKEKIAFYFFSVNH